MTVYVRWSIWSSGPSSDPLPDLEERKKMRWQHLLSSPCQLKWEMEKRYHLICFSQFLQKIDTDKETNYYLKYSFNFFFFFYILWNGRGAGEVSCKIMNYDWLSPVFSLFFFRISISRQIPIYNCRATGFVEWKFNWIEGNVKEKKMKMMMMNLFMLISRCFEFKINI